MSIKDNFSWALPIVKEIVPTAKPVVQEFDCGEALAIGWELPNGKRYGAVLRRLVAIGGIWKKHENDEDGGYWEVEPDSYEVKEMTPDSLRKVVQQTVKGD